MTPVHKQPTGSPPVSQVQVQRERSAPASSPTRDGVSFFASNTTPPLPPAQLQLQPTGLPRATLKRKLSDTGYNITDHLPARRSPSFNTSGNNSPSRLSYSPPSEAATFAAPPSPPSFTSPSTSCGSSTRGCDEDDGHPPHTTTVTLNRISPPLPPPLLLLNNLHDTNHINNDCDMTTAPAAEHDAAAPSGNTPILPVVEKAPFLGPSNPISKKPPSRSQSPAKRLKSEGPPSTTLDDGDDPADPMDEDTISTSIDVPANRDTAVEMEDVASPPETADLVASSSSSSSSEEDASADSSAATMATQPSTAATSTAAPPPPPLDEQVEMVIKVKTMSLAEGDVMYMISGSWLKRFLAQLPEYREDLSKEELEKDVGPIDNSDIVDTTRLEEIEKRKSDDSMSAPLEDVVGEDNMESTDFQNQEPISSTSLGSADDAVAENFIPIKDMTMGEDYEALPLDVWNSLVSWYGLAKDSPIIRRKVVNTSEVRDSAPNLQVELHPPMFTVYRLRDPTSAVSKESLQKEKQLKPKKVVGEKAEGFQKFLKKVKGLTGIDSGRKVRLWMLKSDQPSSVEDVEKASKKPTKPTGTFKQMALDLQAFLALNPELIEIKDCSNDPNYNGNMRLGTAGLACGGPIVIEEQSSDGEWISDTPIKTTNKFGELITVARRGLASASTARKIRPTASSSRSSSPAKSIPSKPGASFLGARGRERRTPGTCGLMNLGNTCYMNSALQCLRSVEELSKYFLSGEFEKELNPSNPLAHHGKVARAYSGLLRQMFNSSSPSSVVPREFKSIIGRFGPSFSGYQQQDSQEFLAFLLDGMHEDLNRIMKKPYVEKPDSTDEMVGDPEAIKKLAETHWNIYKGRNDSAVADLFGGLYKSTLVCPQCEKVSITFDPFMDLTLPLPIESYWSKEVVWFPKDSSRNKRPVRVPVELPKNTNIAVLKEYFGKKFEADPKKMMVAEIYKCKFYKYYEDDASVSEIQPSDEVLVYELEDTPTSWPAPKVKARSMVFFNEPPPPENPVDSEKLLVPVISRKVLRSNRRYGDDVFGIPFFIVLRKDEQYDCEAIQEGIIQRIQLLTTRDLFAAPVEVEDEPELAGSEELIDAPEVKETSDEEKDGFVDVSMKDAASTTTSEDAERAPVTATTQRRTPGDVANEMFTIKISKRKEDSRLSTGWSTLDEDLDLASRLQPSRNRTPSPLPRPQQQSALFSIDSGGNPGRRSPASTVSDDDDADLYQSAVATPEANEDMMQGSSDEENDTAYSNTDMTAYDPPTIDSTSYYAGENNSSTNVFSSSSHSPATSCTSNGPLIRLGESIVIEFHEDGYDITFGGTDLRDFRGSQTSWLVHVDPELARRRQRRQEKEKRGIHLEDCLDEFAKEEVLSAEDPWYCPRCREHRRASKKFELWKCPDILVIHLKRFSSSRSFRDKIDAQIYCPIEGLDLKDRVGVTDGKEQIYDLIAVDNHYGGLGGGHYTAYVKNWCDQKWYYCDDASVREANSATVVTPAAYLLFYRRRSSRPLGGPEFERITTTTTDNAAASEEEDDVPSRGETPSPTLGIMIGPTPPPRNAFCGFGSVGNDTLWGNSIPKDNDDRGVIESLAGGVSLDEGIGEEHEMTDAVFVPAASAAGPEEEVEEVIVGVDEGLQG